MTFIITIVSFLGVLLVLVFAHEFGHFITAKLSHVKVEEFGIGFPPRLFSFKRGETVYSLNAVPLGGFTKLLGEEDSSLPGSLASKSFPVRFLVLTAGSLMNIILPIFLFTISYVIPHDIIHEKVIIDEVTHGSPAQAAGMEPGDIILKIDDRDVINRVDVSYLIHLNLGTKTNFLLQKPDDSLKEVTANPRWNPPSGQGAIGIMIRWEDTEKVQTSYAIWDAIPLSIQHCWEILVLFRNEVVSWIVQRTAPQLTGPVGIATITGEVVQAGVSPLLEFAALISINLAVINLLPFPGLDGGRLVFLFIEWVRRGRKISPKKEGLIHLIGLILLLVLIIAISYFDIVRIIQGESLIP